MRAQTLRGVLVAVALTLVGAAGLVRWRFEGDMRRARAAQGSLLVATRCGLIEYQEASLTLACLCVP